MARKSPNDINTVPCATCGKVIRYKADVPRHKRLHDKNKAAMMYQCDFEGCTYENLQKSNVTTHSRTHTGEKPKCCPECDYTTSDPGSLTRHRKRVHDYVPKKAGSSTTKKTRRHSPYSRERSLEYSSSPSSQACNELSYLSAFYKSCAMESQPEVVNNTQCPYFTFVWEKDGRIRVEAIASPTCPSPQSLIRVLPGQMPHHLFPANNAGHSLERDKARHDAPSTTSSVQNLSAFPLDFLPSQCAGRPATPPPQLTAICPPETYFDPPPVTGIFEQTYQWKTEPSFLLNGAYEPSPPTYFNQNIHGAEFDCSSFDAMFASSPTPSLYTDSSSSPESYFLSSPASSPTSSSTLSYPNTPCSFPPEMDFNSLISVPPVELFSGVALTFL